MFPRLSVGPLGPLAEFGPLMEKTRRVAAALGRTVPTPSALTAVAR